MTDLARYGQAFKDRAVARLLPPESALDVVAPFCMPTSMSRPNEGWTLLRVMLRFSEMGGVCAHRR